MEKQLFMWCNLYLLPEKQLCLLLCLIGLLEGFLLIAYMYYIKKYSIGLPDFCWVIFCMPLFTYMLFMVDHLTFFSCLFYIQVFILIFYFIVKKYSIKNIKKDE